MLAFIPVSVKPFVATGLAVHHLSICMFIRGVGVPSTLRPTDTLVNAHTCYPSTNMLLLLLRTTVTLLSLFVLHAHCGLTFGNTLLGVNLYL